MITVAGNQGIVIREASKVVASRAAKLDLKVEVSDGWTLPWRKTLFFGGKYSIPWDIVLAGFGFLERWDAAAPFWRQDKLAADVGTHKERQRTERIILDLRVPLYEPDLLFVRDSTEGKALVDCWQEERQAGDDEHLAFLRALHFVKPRFLALPTTWLAEVRRQSQQAMLHKRGFIAQGGPLVRVELEPGRFVKCRKGDEARVRAHFKRQRAARRQ